MLLPADQIAAWRHTVLPFGAAGVELDIDEYEVRACAGRERVEQLLARIQHILQADRLSPTEAVKFAGKLHFVCS